MTCRKQYSRGVCELRDETEGNGMTMAGEMVGSVFYVATDGDEIYDTELEKTLSDHYAKGFDRTHAAEVFGKGILGVATDHFMELTHRDRERVFNLGYFTWVEQQGISIDDFSMRKREGFWSDLRALIPAWDGMIEEFNKQTAVMDRF